MTELWQHIIADFSNLGSPTTLSAFFQVLMIDIMLAGDNAIIVGALAAGLDPKRRKQVILIGIAAALVLRILFALAVTQLLQVVGLTFAGGLLLLWVAFRMWRELRQGGGDSEGAGLGPNKSFLAAAWAVAVADVSMSLDNVLAVAGAAREHPGILIVGLLLSVILMGVAANYLARLIERFRWIAWIGLLVILYVALKMIYEGLTNHRTGILTLLGF
jgi:YjbE family integral membrane protein